MHKTKVRNVVRLISQLLLSRIKLMRGGAVEPFTVLMVKYASLIDQFGVVALSTREALNGIE